MIRHVLTAIITEALADGPRGEGSLRPAKRISAQRGFKAALAVMVGLQLAAPTDGFAKTAQSIADDRSGAAQVVEPKLLSPADIARYRQVFSLQEAGRFNEADSVIRQIDNPILLGHVQFQRYMHPTAYRSRFGELATWLERYGDHPGAYQVYTLARKRHPSGAPAPKRPEPRVYRQRASTAPDALTPRSNARGVRNIKGEVRSLVRRERPSQALRYLSQSAVKKTLGRNEMDDALALVASSYFAEGVDQKAVALAADVAERNRREVPLADWTAGLAAWRLGDLPRAAHHFDALAEATTAGTAVIAAGAYWASRAHLSLREPERVGPLLEVAAQYPRTFYGVLAIRQLGRDLPFDWAMPPIDRKTFSELTAYPSVARAVALTEVGQTALAEDEMMRAHGWLPSVLDAKLLALAEKLSLPSVQLQIAEGLEFEGFDGGRYPVPDYAPAGGFTVDRALLYAFMRQESRFKTAATSRAGARGLMQVMPRTASHVTGDRALARRERDKLLEPAFNLAVAQNYLHELMGMVEPRGNLFMLAVAYNGGPGNLARWRRQIGADNDPLLFVESIPSPETRNYIERVLTNYWAYRDRFGQGAPSLDAVAAGEWPVYSPRDGASQSAR